MKTIIKRVLLLLSAGTFVLALSACYGTPAMYSPDGALALPDETELPVDQE